MDDEIRRALNQLDARHQTLADQLARIEQSVRRVEAGHQEVRQSIEKARRAIKVALPFVRKMLG